jgi:anti-sigma-K factor RskA
MSIKDEREMELLSAYLDEELEGESKERMNAFLATSPEGRKALEELRLTKSLFVATPRISAPTDLLDLLEAKAERAMERQTRQSFWNWSNPWAWTSMTATASAAVVALAVALHTPRQIPFQTLMAAHASAHGVGGVHQNVVSAAQNASFTSADTNAKA